MPDATTASSRMADLIARFDWASTPLGAMTTWPQSLKTAVDIMQASGHAMMLAWGPERTLLYNDAYAPLLGNRHPGVLGLPFREARPDIWGEVEPLVARVFAGETVRYEHLPLVLTRHGYAEETWWNFSYSPVRDESGAVAGLLNVTMDTTPRVRAERAERELEQAHARLRESAERLRALLQASSDVVYSMSPDWRELRQLEGRGFMADTLAPNINWLDAYIFPEDQAEAIAAVDKAIATRSPLEIEHRIRRVDGTPGWIVSRAVPILGEDGEIAEWFGMAADATERRRAELALRDSELRYRSLFESIDEGFCIIEAVRDGEGEVTDLKFRDVNHAFEEHAGLSGIKGKRVGEVLPNFEQDWIDIYSRVLKTGHPERAEHYVADVGRWFRVHYFRVAGERSGLVGILFEDVSERRRREQALAESEERLSLALEAGELASWDWDVRTGSINWSDRHFLIQGYSIGEVTPSYEAWLARVHPEDRDETVALIERARVSKGVYEHDYRMLRPDGSIRWCSARGRFFYDDAGEPCRMVGVMDDVTQRRQTEAALRASEEKLLRDLDRTKHLQAVSMLLIEGEEDDKLYERILDAAMAIMRADFGSVQMLDHEHATLDMLAWRNFDPSEAAFWRKVTASSGSSCGLALKEGRRVILPDVAAAGSPITGDALARHRLAGIASAQSTPLVTRGGKLIGMISTLWRQPHAPDEDDLRSLDILARQAADYFEGAAAEAALRENEAWLAGQNEAFQAAINDAPLEETLGLLGRTAIAQMPGARYAFYVLYPGRRELRHVVGMSMDYAISIDGLEVSEDSFSCGLAIATATPVITPDVREEPRWAPWRWLANKHGYRGCWSFPVETSGGKMVGSFAVYFPEPREATQRERDLAGKVTRAAAIIISRRNEADERERAEAALKDSEQRFRQFAAASSGALWIRNADTLAMEYVSPSIATIYGVDPDYLMGDIRRWAALILPEDRDVALARIEQARQGESVVHEFRIQHPSDRTFRWIRNTDFPLRNDQGRIQRVGGITEDVTAAKLAVEHQRILLAELQHRVRNIMAIIRSLTERTAKNAVNVRDYAARMSGRLLALARVQALLTRAANAKVGVRSIVRDEVSAQASHEGQYVLEGSDIELSPKAAEVLTLAVHELATNALKYGALSVPTGKVTVRWEAIEKRNAPWLVFDWIEEGAPEQPKPETDEPRRRGFGSELIEGRIPYELKGNGRLAIGPGGARCHLEFPLQQGASVLETGAPQRTRAFGGALDMSGEADLSGRRVLVVEDDYYLATDAARVLRGVGAEVIGPCASEEEAQAELATQRPDAVLVDINLGPGPSFKLAERLKDHGIPFVFVTGYDQQVLPPEFDDVERLEKPVQLRRIVGAIGRLVAPA